MTKGFTSREERRLRITAALGPPTVESAVKALGLLSLAALGISVAFDYGFLSALGLDFATVPTTIGDHTRSAIVWLPPIAGIGVMCVVMDIALNRLADRWLVHDAAKIEAGGESKETRWHFARLLFLIAYLPVFGLVIIVEMVGVRKWSVAWLILVFGLLAALALIYELWRAQLAGKSVLLWSGMCVYFSAIVLALFWGYVSAERLVNVQSPEFTVTLKNGNSEAELKVNGIRRYSGVSVIVRTDGQVAVVPNERIVETRGTPAAQVAEILRIPPGGGGGPGPEEVTEEPRRVTRPSTSGKN